MIINIDGCNFDVNSCKITLENGQDFQMNDDGGGLYVRSLHDTLSIHPTSDNSIKIFYDN